MRGVTLTRALLLACSALPLHAQARRAARGWPVAPAAAIKVHAAGGTLRLIGWDRDSVHVAARLADGESVFGGGSRAALKLGIEGSATRGASEVTVHVPHGATVVVRSGAAAVAVSGLRRMLDVGAAAGRVSVEGTLESLVVETVNGDIVARVDAGTARLRSASGAITLSGRVRDATLSTVLGRVQLDARVQSAARIATVDGSATLHGALDDGASLDIETFGGAVVLLAPAPEQFALDLRSDRGAITHAPGGGPAVARIEPVGRASTLRWPGRGGRAPSITVRTLSGRIEVGRPR